MGITVVGNRYLARDGEAKVVAAAAVRGVAEEWRENRVEIVIVEPGTAVGDGEGR